MIELNGEKFYTAEETAQLLAVTKDTVRKYCRRQWLNSEKIYGSYAISESSIKEFCKRGKEK